MRALIVLACAALACGVPLEKTAEVLAAEADHFAAVEAAKARVQGADAYLADTAEVAAAKTAHLTYVQPEQVAGPVAPAALALPAPVPVTYALPYYGLPLAYHGFPYAGYGYPWLVPAAAAAAQERKKRESDPAVLASYFTGTYGGPIFHPKHEVLAATPLAYAHLGYGALGHLGYGLGLPAVTVAAADGAPAVVEARKKRDADPAVLASYATGTYGGPIFHPKFELNKVPTPLAYGYGYGLGHGLYGYGLPLLAAAPAAEEA